MKVSSLTIIGLQCLLMISLEGRDGELVVKELAVVDSHSNSLVMYLRDRTAGKKYQRLTPE